ncbi:MAG TPA: response regulator transcription factor [Candidatus Cybelea sp.]|nr:response regulator transcription factor [Candidatus Cybelea sp.]
MNETAARNIRILLVDDHALFRESVARLLHAEPGFEVVADCSSAAEGLEILRSREIDVLLLDLDLGPERGTELLGSLRTGGFRGKILLVTAGLEESELPDLIRKGISGVFLKHGSPAALIRGIREAMEGKALFEQNALRRALENAEQVGNRRAGIRLTERERRVLSLIFEGLANKQIADRLQISESAVKACLQQLFGKTGVRTRSQLVRIALERYRDQL